MKNYENRIGVLEETLLMDHSETLRKEKLEYQEKIRTIKQRTNYENQEADRIREEIPQIRENINHRQKQHEILL